MLMTASFNQRLRLLRLLASGVILAVLPVGFASDPQTGAWQFGAPAAYAGDADDSGRDDDRDDDDDDRYDDRDDDRDDQEDDRDDNEGGGSADVSGSSGAALSLPDISLRYEDGWVEQIVNGRYELFDDRGRRVIRRRANLADYNRMAALIG